MFYDSLSVFLMAADFNQLPKKVRPLPIASQILIILLNITHQQTPPTMREAVPPPSE